MAASPESPVAARGVTSSSAEAGSPPVRAAVAALSERARSVGRRAAAAANASRAVNHASCCSASLANSIHACTTESSGGITANTRHASRAERHRISRPATIRRAPNATGGASRSSRTPLRIESGTGKSEKIAACSMYGIVSLASRQLRADGIQSPSAPCICANSAAKSRVPPIAVTASRSTVSAAAARPWSSSSLAKTRNGAASRGDNATHCPNATADSESRLSAVSVRNCTVRSVGSFGRRASNESTSGKIASLPPTCA